MTLFFCLITSFRQIQNKKIIVGHWAFEKFVYPNYISPNEKFAIDANKANKGLTVTFTADNKFISQQKNGLKANNVTTWYKILNDNKHLIIDGDTSEIDLLNDKYLHLFHDNNKPVVVFRRIQ